MHTHTHTHPGFFSACLTVELRVGGMHSTGSQVPNETTLVNKRAFSF